MAIKIGLVGLPNAGKSTLFNSLTKLSVPAENYPFNTIEPNVGVAEVRDLRIEKISSLIRPEKTNYAQVQFYDIAGLVKGASKGEGLGNQFLANIREVDGIAMVLRDFIDSSVEHVAGSVSARRDREILETELQLKDIESVEKRITALEKISRTDELASKSLVGYKRLLAHLSDGKNASDFPQEDESFAADISQLQLLTNKPIIYVVNTTDYARSDQQLIEHLGLPASAEVIAFDVRLEAELLDDDQELSDMGIESAPGIERLTQACFYGLDFIVYITAGEQEVRSWAVKRDTNAAGAAGKIHADFFKKFIAAEIASFEDFERYGSWENLRAEGKVRREGKDYIMQDGDIVIFKIGA